MTTVPQSFRTRSGPWILPLVSPHATTKPVGDLVGDRPEKVRAILSGMSRPVPQVFDDALALGDDDRAKLAARLVESLDGDIDADAGDAWAAEIERRLARIDTGEAKLLSMDDAVARLHRAARAR